MKWQWNRRAALWLLLILTFVAAVRVRLLSSPMERDEGEYAYAGRLMLEGVPPYRLLYNMKMPGIYAGYAVSMAIFGQTVEGMRMGLLVINLATIVLVYFLARRFVSPAGAVAADAAYALLSLSPRVFGTYMHATHFVVLAAIGGILILLRAQDNGRLGWFFAGGGLFGVAFLMKQPGGAYALFGATVLLWTAARQKPRDWKRHGLRMLVYCAGVAVPIGLTAIVLWRAGVWQKFWWWTVQYAGVHATARSWSEGARDLFKYLTKLGWDMVFWLAAAAGMVCLCAEKDRSNEKFFLGALLAFSFLAICPGFYFTEHYFVLILPALAVLCGKAFDTAASQLAARSSGGYAAAPWMVFGLLCIAVVWSHRMVFFELSPEAVTATTYPANEFQVYQKVGDYLRAHTPANSTIAVLGSEPELPFYAHRRSVTGYVYMYDLVQTQPFRETMEHEMRDEVERGKPDYVIIVNLEFSWLADRLENIAPLRQWMVKFTRQSYEPYGAVTFAPHRYVWGPDSFQKVPPQFQLLSIYKRKPDAANPAKSPP